ncbi:MAG: SUMF1/EgtB/PvdO family nonheme iron enzyme, partial [Bacteroidota bacterium]
MKKVLLFCLIVAGALLSGCGNSGNGYLIGAQDREEWYQPDPFGMLFIPMGSYNMGPSDQDVAYSMTAQSKTVSVQAFWMDETEITNNEYRQFVEWVRDSLVHRILGEGDEEHLIAENEYGEALDPPTINWRTRIQWDEPEVREALETMYYPVHERFYRKREFDTRKLMFEYYWIDYKKAASKANRFDFETGKYLNGIPDRSAFIVKDVLNIYPDTLCWVHDFTYSFNEPMTNAYFWHPAFDNYPVVGVTWKQARAFCIWRTQLLNTFLSSRGETTVQ